MNDRLNVQVLRSQLQDAISRIEPLPDEPTFSYVTRVALLTGTMKRGEVIAELFGRASIRPEQLVHAGFGHFAAHFMSEDGSCRGDMSLAHSMLGLFAPFLPSDRLRRAVSRANGSSVTGINELAGYRKAETFRASPAICLECVDSDLKKHLCAYYRRTHQVSAVTVCHDHGTPLIVCCEACRKTFSYEDLPSLHCQFCGEPLLANESALRLSSDPRIAVKFSKAIHASLNGMLRGADAASRGSALRDRVALKIDNRSSVVGDNLASRLCDAFGRSYLESVGLRPDMAPTLGWPALMINQLSFASQPIANCLLVALLFESVEEFNEALIASVGQPHNMAIAAVVSNATSKITPTILKDIMRPGSLRDVGIRHKIPNELLKKWVAAYPGLSDRRKRSTERVMLRRCKRKVAEYVRNYPDKSRTQVCSAYKFEIGYLLRNDRKWLDGTIPTQRNLVGAVVRENLADSADDKIMAKALLNSVLREKAMLARPRQLTIGRLLSRSGLAVFPEKRRYAFSETMALASELAESTEDFYRRCLEWGANDLARCNGQCDHIVELFVHARVSVKYVRALEPFAKNLLAGLAGTRGN
jgi:hypothetical protein